MSRNPFINALCASGYIVLVASFMQLVSKNMGDKPDTFFAPVAFLSMFVLSASVMAFIFFYQPVTLFIEGKKKEAVNLFAKTLGSFGVITLIIWTLMFSGLI